MTTAPTRQQRTAVVYDAEIWPLVPRRSAGAILRHLPRIPSARVLEVGTATGHLAMEMAALLDGQSQVVAVDGSPDLIALAQAARKKHPAGDKVTFQVVDDLASLPRADGGYDLVVSNLVLAESDSPAAAVAGLVDVLKPGGRFLATFPLRGAWAEFLDLYADVLSEQARGAGVAALRSYQQRLPDVAEVTRWTEDAGLQAIGVDVERWELLFRSAREFFFAPVVELGPLDTWKRIAGGRGEQMQDLFFFVKEAIETYFAGSPFAVTMVVGCVRGTKPGAAAPAS